MLKRNKQKKKRHGMLKIKLNLRKFCQTLKCLLLYIQRFFFFELYRLDSNS